MCHDFIQVVIRRINPITIITNVASKT